MLRNSCTQSFQLMSIFDEVFDMDSVKIHLLPEKSKDSFCLLTAWKRANTRKVIFTDCVMIYSFLGENYK